MIDSNAELSVRRQCELLNVSRSGLYYEPVPTSPDELALMRRIDELHLERPFYGSRKVAAALKAEGVEVNRKSVQRLMRLMTSKRWCRSQIQVDRPPSTCVTPTCSEISKYAA